MGGLRCHRLRYCVGHYGVFRSAVSARPFRLTYYRPTEAQVLASVLEMCNYHPAVAWCGRYNSGAVRFDDNRDDTLRWYGETRPARFVRFNNVLGHSDILGMLKGGRLFAFEVKRPGERATTVQHSFLDQVNRDGGLAAVVHSVDEARAVIEAAALVEP